MGGLRVENVMVSIDGKPVSRNDISKSIKYLPQGRLIPEGMVNYRIFVNRFPKYSRHYDSPIYELSGGEALPTISLSLPMATPIQPGDAKTWYFTGI